VSEGSLVWYPAGFGSQSIPLERLRTTKPPTVNTDCACTMPWCLLNYSSIVPLGLVVHCGAKEKALVMQSRHTVKAMRSKTCILTASMLDVCRHWCHAWR
jgi:hypothetical protein